jgi:acyl carrier protein
VTADSLAPLREFIDRTYGRAVGRALTAEEPLVSSGIIDSFGLVDLSLFVEERFGVRIDASDLGAHRADSAGEIARLIESRTPPAR